MNTVDRNQAIGLVLISGMLIAYFSFFSNNKESETDGISSAPKIETLAPKTDSIIFTDTVALKKQYGYFSNVAAGKEADYILENEDIKVTISSKGAAIKSVLLKKYKTYTKQDLYLLSPENNKLSLVVSTQNGKTDLSSLFYSAEQKNIDNQSVIIFRLLLSPDKVIEQTYKLSTKGGYELGYDLKMAPSIQNILTDKNLEFKWTQRLQNIEKDLTASRQAANITYRLMNGTYSSLSEAKLEAQEVTMEGNANWVTFKQKFFSAGFIAQNGFSSGTLKSDVNQADSSVVKSFEATLTTPIADIISGKGSFKFFFGPNKLSIVSDVAPSFNENVYLGWPVINTINRYTIAPLFSFLEKFINNYGIIIICMVLLIKAVLFPLSFQSYKSMAKMKVLKPELDEIKSRVGEDMSAVQQEQMKLYQQVGVNPLSGCIPVLLQMPVLLAMFNFFPNAIELRQQPFLWAEDLSTYDSIINLPFKIPFYGDHVSLFTLLMTASTILYTWYNNQMNVSATGPMVAMSYIMPLVFMFILNSMPAGLSFYYFVSNMITIGQQNLIKLFVDEKAIRVKLEDNKKNAGTRKPNRFQQRLMSAMEQQKELKKQAGKPKK